MDGMKMKPGKRTSGPASLLLTYCPSLPSPVRGRALEVTHVVTPVADRRKGHASALLKSVCAEADAAGKLLLLFPKPFDVPELTGEQLASWYGRFGFSAIQVEPVVMMVRQAVGGTKEES